MVHLPRTCERCKAKLMHYGLCRETRKCREEAEKIVAMSKLVDLALEINPKLGPREKLAGQVITISMSKDGITASAVPAR